MKLFGWTGKKSERPLCSAVIVAAGSSRRMGGVDKIMAELHGQSVIAHTIRAFELSDCIDEIIVVTRKDLIEPVREQACGFTKVTQVIEGGSTRIESVKKGLLAVRKDAELAAIQDGARPLVTEEIIREAVSKAQRCHAAAPAVPVKDTIKAINGSGRVTATPARDTLRAVQTPQVFDRDLLLAAWEKASRDGIAYTDDCGAMEGLGVPVYLTEGNEENIKITTPLDLLLAEEIMKRREPL